MESLNRRVLKASCSAFCSALKGGSFDTESLIYWMQAATNELTKEKEEEKEPGQTPGPEHGQEHGQAAQVSVPDGETPQG